MLFHGRLLTKIRRSGFSRENITIFVYIWDHQKLGTLWIFEIGHSVAKMFMDTNLGAFAHLQVLFVSVICRKIPHNVLSSIASDFHFELVTNIARNKSTNIRFQILKVDKKMIQNDTMEQRGCFMPYLI